MPRIEFGSYGSFGFRIKVDGWQKIVGKFGSMPARIARALKEGGEVVIAKAKEYPWQSGRSYGDAYGYRMLNIRIRGRKSFDVRSPFLTARQHKWFFANIGKGFTTPRNRTQHFANSWYMKPSPATVEIKNDAGYGGFLMGNGSQSEYHSDNWPTIDDVVDQMQGTVVGILKAEIDDMLK